MDIGSVHQWSAQTISEQLAAKNISAVEVTEALLDRTDRLDGQLGTFVTVDGEGALKAARESDGRRAAGKELSGWDGVPITVKDLISTKGIRTTYGSTLFADHVPAFDDIAVERVRAAGLVVLGKANTPEFGAAAESYGKVQVTCRNPWDPELTSGGSSGGSAAGLAAGLTPLSIGNDGGGSIRLPAALCGVVGLKPSRGRVAAGHAGQQPAFNPVSVTGPMARTVDDAAGLFEIIAGSDPRDPQSVFADRRRELPTIAPDASVRAACSWSLGLADMGSQVGAVVRAAVASMAGGGVEVEEVELDLSDPHPVSALFPLIGMKSLQRYGEVVAQDPGAITDYARAFLDRAASLSGLDMAEALRDGEILQARMDRLFVDHDILITPATSVPAWPHLVAPDEIDGVPAADWKGVRYGAWPCLGPFNLTGHPALVVPCGFTEAGLPVALQLVGPMNGEGVLLEAGRRIEKLFRVATLAPAFDSV